MSSNVSRTSRMGVDSKYADSPRPQFIVSCCILSDWSRVVARGVGAEVGGKVEESRDLGSNGSLPLGTCYWIWRYQRWKLHYIFVIVCETESSDKYRLSMRIAHVVVYDDRRGLRLYFKTHLQYTDFHVLQLRVNLSGIHFNKIGPTSNRRTPYFIPSLGLRSTKPAPRYGRTKCVSPCSNSSGTRRNEDNDVTQNAYLA